MVCKSFYSILFWTVVSFIRQKQKGKMGRLNSENFGISRVRKLWVLYASSPLNYEFAVMHSGIFPVAQGA